jgi:hypothetical protein
LSGGFDQAIIVITQATTKKIPLGNKLVLNLQLVKKRLKK